MEKLTKEEFEYLSKYEDRLKTAVGSNFVRAVPSGAVHKMREIYSRLIGKTYSMNENCGGCILTLCKKLNTPYNEYKETIEGDSTGCTTETDTDTPEISGGEVQTGDTKRTKNKYGVSQVTLNSDFLKALAELKNQQEPFTSSIKQIIADRYETLWTAAMERGDLKTATNILKQESDLFGLNTIKQDIDVNAGEFEITFN